MLEEFPSIHQTFNLVPSMIEQIEEYARGEAQDPFLRCALKPADQLTPDEQAFILKYFFQANASRLIYRYPRFGELYDAWRDVYKRQGRRHRASGHRAKRRRRR